MKNMTRLVLSITALVSSTSFAIDKNAQFAIKGVGNVACQQYVGVVEADDPQKFLFAGWINGYITAHNQHIDETFDITSWENIETLGNYLIEHCRKNPQLSFYQATTQMVNQLYADRIVEFTGAENMASGSQSAKIYTQVITRVQSALIEQALFDGEADGKMSPELMQAVNRFRIAKGLPESLSLDQRTLHALLRQG